MAEKDERAWSAGELREQVDRIVASAGFSNARRMAQFLRFVVDEALANRGERLKEYVIAIEVFDRDKNFDPQTSSVVRVEASRLRAKLEEYYRQEGANDPIIVELPRGRWDCQKICARAV